MRRSLLLLVGWLGCVTLVVAIVPAPGQTPSKTPAQRPPVFTKQVDLVRLDVSVIGKDRLPVRGLTAEDFIVKEDGKPQKVVALTEVVMDDAPPPPVAWMRDVTPDVTTNTIEDSRLIIIVIDDALIPIDPRITKDTKKVIADVINKLSPSDYTAIVFTADGRKAQDFTHDRATLVAAADKFTGGIASYTFGQESAGAAGPQVDPDSHYYWSSVKTLTSISDYLIAVPQRRKALIWISPGVPADLAGSGPMRGPSIAGDAPVGGSKSGAPAPPPPANGVNGFLSDHEIMARLMDDTRELFRRAQRANVVIYPIDPTGLGGLERYIQGKVSKGAWSELAHEKATLSFEFVETAAANTGGHAIVNTDDFGPGIDQIFKENSSYYLIGFQPLNAKDDGTLRRIDVKVNRPGVEVLARSGYYAPSAADNAKAAKASENVVLAKAIGGLLPETALPLGVTVAPFAIPGQHTAAVTIAMGVRQPVPAEAAKSKITETTELQISAFTPDGDARGTQRSTAHVKLVQGATGDAEYEVLGRIDLAPGRYALRLAAHSASDKKTGSVAANVVVPDFTNDAFSISGVVVSRSPAKASAPKDLLSSVVPIVPTADREFAIADRVTTFLRLYQSGRKPVGDVTLVTRILNDHGGTDASETQVLGVDRFVAPEPTQPAAATGPATGPGIPIGSGPASRARTVGQPAAEKADPFANQWLRTADVRYDIPVAKLTRGQYLLTFEATSGTTTLRRDVRFGVK